MDTRAAAVAAARTTRAAAAAATLRRLAARAEPRVTLRTVYVRGVAGESRTWRLRDILAAVTRLPRRAVVHASRCSDLIEVRVLAEHADAFEAAVALSPDARDLTLVSGVDPLSVSLLGSRRRRGLTGEQAREKARDCHVARCRAQLGSLDGRVGMPAAHRAALRAALTRELAPFVRVLGAGGAEATRAARRGADRGDPVLAAARGAAVDVGGNRRGDENPSPTAPTTAAASAGVPEFSKPPHSPTADFSPSAAAAAAQHKFDGDRGEADMVTVMGKAPVMTTATDPTPESDRATSPGAENSRRPDGPGLGRVRAAARHRDGGVGAAMEDDPPAAGRGSPAPGDVSPATLADAAAMVADLLARPLASPPARPPPPPHPPALSPTPNGVHPSAAHTTGAARGGVPAPLPDACGGPVVVRSTPGLARGRSRGFWLAAAAAAATKTAAAVPLPAPSAPGEEVDDVVVAAPPSPTAGARAPPPTPFGKRRDRPTPRNTPTASPEELRKAARTGAHGQAPLLRAHVPRPGVARAAVPAAIAWGAPPPPQTSGLSVGGAAPGVLGARRSAPSRDPPRQRPPTVGAPTPVAGNSSPPLIGDALAK